MVKRKFRKFACDLETTVYKGQKHTEAWAAALVELYTEDVKIHHSLPEFFDEVFQMDGNIMLYFHNLKFDGAFLLSYFLKDLKWEQALTQDETPKWLTEREMKNNTIKYSVSQMGQWYTIILKHKDRVIEIRDSLKLLPFSLKRIGQSFKTKHQKLDMEYKGFRYAGCTITDAEKKYIANDVLVLKEGLEFMFDAGHDKLTIGSCCLAEFKAGFSQKEYDTLFPNLYDIELPEEYGSKTAGEWVRKSYKGGWCYLVRGKENTVYRNGTTYDVNSLYPSMMHSESGNRYPIGEPTFWSGNYIPRQAKDPHKFFFVRLITRFELRQDKLPFIQMKGNPLYRPNECLETSDIRDRETGEYFPFYKDYNGDIRPATVELTLTQLDYALLLEHYALTDFEILDGCYFNTEIGLFDPYINKYKEIKQNSTGAVRESAKLFLNNLYGKMAANTDSSFKTAFVKEDGSLGFKLVWEEDKNPGYIPIGSAITSYARNFTIRAAQSNYHGANNRGFIYADTDSIHCDLTPDEILNITCHPTAFCCWKMESKWDTAIFARQKTYIEHIIADDKGEVKPHYDIKCAGMPETSKQLFRWSLEQATPTNDDGTPKQLPPDHQAVLDKQYTLEDFKVGLELPGKLLPKRISGGIVLTDTTYQMRPI